ncbi:MAG: hypothetical protein ACJASY_002485 [Halioglobus sp.]|jgi:hypothetical protein
MAFKPLRNLHKNQSGEMPIGPILIIALVVLPLIFMLITFRDSAQKALETEASEVFGKGTDKTEINQ